MFLSDVKYPGILYSILFLDFGGGVEIINGRFVSDRNLKLYLANLHTSFLCNLIYPTFSRILLYSC